jgi:hypothetical protein
MAGTPYSDVFTYFLGRLENSNYVNMDDDDILIDEILLLNIAIDNFEYPKISLTKSDTTALFTNTLTNSEIQIIALLMVVEWVKRQINNINLIKQNISTKDFKMTSQAEHLKNLLLLKTEIESEVEIKKTKYSYKSGNVANFSGLSGGSTTSTTTDTTGDE